MKFTEVIQQNDYFNELKTYGHNVLLKNNCKCNDTREEILSQVLEIATNNNTEVYNTEQFKKGWWAKSITFSLYNWNYKNKNIQFNGGMNNTSGTSLYRDIVNSEYTEDILLNVEKLELIPHLVETLSQPKSVNYIEHAKARNIAKKVLYGTYKGVARLKNGKIDKVYPHTRDVTKDGFVPGRVIALCKGKGNKKGRHLGFKWCYICDIKIENTKIN